MTNFSSQRFVGSLYSLSRDFPQDEPSAENIQEFTRQVSPVKSGGPAKKFRPLDSIKTEIIKCWKPEYITDQQYSHKDAGWRIFYLPLVKIVVT